jgi:plasmid stabilization system protein ParE
MKVEYSKRAVSDLRKIADYHRRSDNPAAIRFEFSASADNCCV